MENRERSSAGGAGRLRLGQTEIEDLDPPLRRHLDVRGLEIAVDDPLAVGGVERLGELPGDAQDLVHGQRAGPNEALGQRLAVNELHDQEARVAGLFEAVDRRDVGMIERGEYPRLASEARQPGRVVRELLGKYLDRDLAAKAQIGGAVDLAHPARPERRTNLVSPEPDAWRKSHVKPRRS